MRAVTHARQTTSKKVEEDMNDVLYHVSMKRPGEALGKSV